jgi:hypothetical protein
LHLIKSNPLRKQIFIFLFFYSIHFFVFSQQRLENSNLDSILKRHYKFGNISNIGGGVALIDTQNLYAKNCILSGTELIWKSGKLIYLLNGTGRFYSANSGEYKREDQTCYGGANFGSINFAYKDTLYSLGGYGFWQYNSATRYYKETLKEWDMIPSNQIDGFSRGLNAFVSYGRLDSSIYVIYKKVENEYLSNAKSNDTVFIQRFDLIQKKWWSSPRILNNQIAKDFGDISIIQETGLGLLIHTRQKPFALLLDFPRNRAFEIDPRVSSDLIQYIKKIENGLSFYDDEKIYLLDISKNALVQFFFKKDQLKFSAINIYEQLEPAFIFKELRVNLWILILGALIFTFTLFIVFRRAWAYRIEMPKSIHSNSFLKGDVSIFLDSLNEKEKNLIRVFSRNMKENKNTTIAEVNQVLSLEKRPFKIQNNIRASVIADINKRFEPFLSSSENLITRERSKFDQRYFEYSINAKFRSIFENL